MIKEQVEFRSGAAKLKGFISIPSLETQPLPGIILCHGFTNSKTECPMIQRAAELLVEAGFATFQFDFFGSGESDGIFREKTISLMIQNLKNAMPLFLEHPRVIQERIGIWGRSIGASVALTQTAHPSVKALCLASPLTNFSGYFNRLNVDPSRQYVPLPASIQHGNIRGPWEVNQQFFGELRMIDEHIERLGITSETPTCIFQGRADNKVGLEDTKEFFKKLHEPKRLLIVNAGHDYTGAEAEVLSEMLAWFSEYV
jgi:dipeptidyl aminopeptidase/acylaminoacyl peptidase